MTLFEEYIQASRGLAFVATSKQNQPSIRIMGFAADPDQPNMWYFNCLSFLTVFLKANDPT